MTQGFINIHRDIMNWGWYKNHNVKIVFIHLLLKANFTQKKWEDRTIERGSFITGVNKLSDELNMSTQKIRLALKKLSQTNEITIKTTNKYSIITVCNYDTYQSFKTQSKQSNNKQKTINQQTSNYQTTTTNNVNNINNDKNENKRGFQVSDKISNKLKSKIEEYIEYRKDINKPYKSQKSIDALITKLKNQKEETSIKEIDQSIINGWQTIYPLKKSSAKNFSKSELYEPKKSTRTSKNRLQL